VWLIGRIKRPGTAVRKDGSQAKDMTAPECNGGPKGGTAYGIP